MNKLYSIMNNKQILTRNDFHSIIEEYGYDDNSIHTPIEYILEIYNTIDNREIMIPTPYQIFFCPVYDTYSKSTEWLNILVRWEIDIDAYAHMDDMRWTIDPITHADTIYPVEIIPLIIDKCKIWNITKGSEVMRAYDHARIGKNMLSKMIWDKELN